MSGPAPARSLGAAGPTPSGAGAKCATVLHVGDSISHCGMSADWVRLLRLSPELQAAGYQSFINTAVDGYASVNVLRMLPAAFAKLALPKSEQQQQQEGAGMQGPNDCGSRGLRAITLLVGTNDVLATLGGVWYQVFRWQHGVTSRASLERYRTTMAAVLDTVHAHAPAAELLLLTLPPLGSEDLTSALNARVEEHNAVLRELARDAAGAGRHVRLLDLYAACAARLASQPHQQPAAAPQPTPTGATAASAAGAGAGDATLGLPFRRALYGFFITGLRRSIWRMSYDEAAALEGFRLLASDCIHLNDTAAKMIAGMVQEALLGLGPAPPAAAAAEEAR